MCKLNVDRVPPTLQAKFGSFYFCFNVTNRGFKTACRPFIGVDGCHLKIKYGGQLVVAIRSGPNECYYPLEFGVVETETKGIMEMVLDLAFGGCWSIIVGFSFQIINR